MATVQPEGTNIVPQQSSQVIPVITTEGSEENNGFKDSSSEEKSKIGTESDISVSKDSSSVFAAKNNGRVRQPRIQGGRYYTTGVIEGIKV